MMYLLFCNCLTENSSKFNYRTNLKAARTCSTIYVNTAATLKETINHFPFYRLMWFDL